MSIRIVVPDFEALAATLRRAAESRRAWRPMVAWPISPSSSAFGVSAATESTATRSNESDRTSWSTISSAISPDSGCEISSSGSLIPSAAA